MRTVHVQQREGAWDAMRLSTPESAHYDTLIEEPSLIYEGDELRVVFLDAEPEARSLLKSLQNIRYGMGSRTGGAIKGLISRSTTIGTMPRVAVRRDYCRISALARDSPRDHALICAWGGRATELYEQHNPKLFAAHAEAVRGVVREDWLLPGSLFTSGICNKDSQLGYHFDAGNFRGYWSCMYAFTNDIAGGYLVIPAFGLAFNFDRPRLIMFDGQGYLHGVLPWHKRSARAYRYTVVYYALQQCSKCLAPAEELERVRRVKTQREQRRVACVCTLICRKRGRPCTCECASCKVVA